MGWLSNPIGAWASCNVVAGNTFARACGGHGFAARRPDELKKAISDALAIDGPAIVDAVVAANELPNLPHLDLELLGQVARAKIKEAVLAITGG